MLPQRQRTWEGHTIKSNPPSIDLSSKIISDALLPNLKPRPPRQHHHPTKLKRRDRHKPPLLFVDTSFPTMIAQQHQNHLNQSPSPLPQSSEQQQPHQGDMAVPQLDGGLRVMTLDEQWQKRKQKGLCPTCGEVKTHKPGLWKTWIPDTVEGISYKGMCLKCSTIDAAKLKLGEPLIGSPAIPESWDTAGKGSTLNQTMLKRSQSETETQNYIGHAGGKMQARHSCLANSAVKSQKAASLENNPHTVKFAVEALERINRRKTVGGINRRRLDHRASMPPVMPSAGLKTALCDLQRRESEGESDDEGDGGEPSTEINVPVRGTRRATIAFENPLEHELDLKRGGGYGQEPMPNEDGTGIHSGFTEEEENNSFDDASILLDDGTASLHSSEYTMEAPTKPLEDLHASEYTMEAPTTKQLEALHSSENTMEAPTKQLEEDVSLHSEDSFYSENSLSDVSDGAFHRGLLDVLQRAQVDASNENDEEKYNGPSQLRSSVMTIGPPPPSDVDMEQNSNDSNSGRMSWDELHQIASSAMTGGVQNAPLKDANSWDGDESGYSSGTQSPYSIDDGTGASRAKLSKYKHHGPMERKSELDAHSHNSQSGYSRSSNIGEENSYHFSDESTSHNSVPDKVSYPEDDNPDKKIVEALRDKYLAGVQLSNGTLHQAVTDGDNDKGNNGKMCPTCGEVHTHSRGVWKSFVPKTIEGLVYKGVCLKCNSLNTAKMKLGEPVAHSAQTSMTRHSSLMNLPLQTQESQTHDVDHGTIFSVDDATSVGGSIPLRRSTNVGVDSVANSCASSYIGKSYIGNSYENDVARGGVDYGHTNSKIEVAKEPEQREMTSDPRKQFGLGKDDLSRRPRPLFRSSMTAIPSGVKKMMSERRLQRRDSVASKISRPRNRRTLTSGMLSTPAYNKSAKKVVMPKPVRDTSDFRCKDTRRFGFFTGTINKDNEPHGRGKMVYDDNHIIQGIWSNGKLIVRDSQDKYKPKRLPGYSIGEMGRKRDMAIKSAESTVVGVHKLHVGDCAFICRSDGTWSYALVKSRSDSDDVSITFQVDSQGCTKIFKILQFVGHVRLPKEPDVLPGFSIGDTGSDKDMIVVDPSHFSTVKTISRLRINDAVFIQRSDHRWTYAIIRDRSDGDENPVEASITIQVDKIGSFKVAKRPLWGTFLRCIKMNNRKTRLTKDEAMTLSILIKKAKARLKD